MESYIEPPSLSSFEQNYKNKIEKWTVWKRWEKLNERERERDGLNVCLSSPQRFSIRSSSHSRRRFEYDVDLRLCAWVWVQECVCSCVHIWEREREREREREMKWEMVFRVFEENEFFCTIHLQLFFFFKLAQIKNLIVSYVVKNQHSCSNSAHITIFWLCTLEPT